MKLIPLIAALATVGLLAACDDKPVCTKADVEKKATDLMTKIQEVGTADPAKMAELLPKIQEISTKAAAAGEEDLQASCDAIDEIMAELAK
jgi:hypothetical protein